MCDTALHKAVLAVYIHIYIYLCVGDVSPATKVSSFHEQSESRGRTLGSGAEETIE